MSWLLFRVSLNADAVALHKMLVMIKNPAKKMLYILALCLVGGFKEASFNYLKIWRFLAAIELLIMFDVVYSKT